MREDSLSHRNTSQMHHNNICKKKQTQRKKNNQQTNHIFRSAHWSITIYTHFVSPAVGLLSAILHQGIREGLPSLSAGVTSLTLKWRVACSSIHSSLKLSSPRGSQLNRQTSWVTPGWGIPPQLLPCATIPRESGNVQSHHCPQGEHLYTPL